MEICHIEEYWSQDAVNYGKIIEHELNSFRKTEWKTVFQRNFPQKTKRILDLGCGPGFFSVLLAEMGFQVIGIDCAEGMLKAAKETAVTCDVEPLFLKMDCEKMDFPENSFDVIVSRNVTWTLRQPEKVYKECQRVLRPGGKLLVFDANWYLHLCDGKAASRVKKRYEKCLLQYGDVFESEEDLPMEFDPEELPLTSVYRPQWDVSVLQALGYVDVFAKENISETLWNAKEKLLYGESPLFFISANKS
jgi:2-polyprenyl-3-methyl-5-hydroxy-6-metoxy-1,4-benzoquinol methylase